MFAHFGLAFLATIQVCPTPSENRIFSEVRTGYPYSVPNAMGVSADGRYIYSGEGGAVAILDTLDPQGYGATAPRIPVSKFGARPAKILVDPGTNPGYADDLLVICAGRSGLWVMDAHPAGPDYRAAVVDDSGNSDPNSQGSRRFCNDAEVFTIDGVEYLAAIFARTQGSRLRIYEMEDVRDVLGNVPVGEWQGGAIGALHDIKLPKRPGMPSQTGQPNLHNYSLSIGLAVDQVDSLNADLYVALWHQGLARVRVDQGTGGGLDVSGVQWGPVFGNGSAYHLGNVANLPHSTESYSNFRFMEDGNVRREEPPVFTDVAVQNTQGHYLYATVDTLGWVRFDLSQPSQNPWNESMEIDHHEGQAFPFAPTPHPYGEIQFALETGSEADFTYPKQIRVVESEGQVLLAVNSTGASIVRNVGFRTEGSVFNYAANSFNGIPDYFYLDEAIIGGNSRVLIYEVDNLGVVTSPGVLPVDDDFGLAPPVVDEFLGAQISHTQQGGKEIAFLPTQSSPANEPLLFVHGGPFTTKVKVTLSPTIGFETLGMREKPDRPVAETFAVGHTILNPDVLVTGSNDGGFPAGGIYATCGSDLVNFYSPDSFGNDGRYAMGNFFDQEGQWEVLDTGSEWAGMQLSVGSGSYKYRVRLFDPGDPCGAPSVPPTLEHTWNIKTLSHRFGERSRWYFQGTVNVDYDADIGQDMLYLSGSSSPQGIVAIDRSAFEAWILKQDNMNNHAPGISQLNLATADDGVVVGTLNTDPEFSNVPTIPETDRFLQEQFFASHPNQFYNIAGGLLTFTPRTVKLPSQQGGSPDTWVLAAPCGFLENGEETLRNGVQFDSYDTNDWEASAPFNEISQLILQFWNVDDPTTFDSNPDWASDGVPADAAAIGGFDAGSAISLRIVEHQGRAYVFTADFGGRVQVFDMTDLLWDTQEPVKLLDTWEVAKSLTDSLPNTVWEIVVDRAQWTSGPVSFDELYVYAAIERVGIEVLHFDPSCSTGPRLQKVALIQTPGNVRSLVIREDEGDKTLLVSDGEAGIRVLEYNQ